MAIPFKSASYQTQVARLRSLAQEALKRYNVRVATLDFIHHGENTTFKVTDKRGKRYLLRVHRADYHSREAILEELAWLEHLATTKIVAPHPIRSKNDSPIETLESPLVDRPRNIDLMEWVEGRFVWKNARPLHLEKIGRLLAELQLDTRSRKVKHRRYWTPEGLMGRDAKLGSVYNIQGVTKREQSIIIGAARDLEKELARYEKKYPKRMGYIHADLHFGNMVFRDDGSLSPIDFDDSGFGFHMYDLAVPLVNIDHLKELKPKTDVDEMHAALIEGYSSLKSLDDDDLTLIEHLRIARRIAMVGWLNSRADNPRLAKRVRGSVDKALAAIKTL